MHKPINVLIVENQSLIIDAFKRALEHIDNTFKNLNFNINIVKNCKVAFAEIKKTAPNNLIDLILLNIDIPPCRTKKVIFIDDLALELKKQFPKTKIIVFALKCDNHRINAIIKELNPDSILINTDVDFNELTHAIKTVLVEPPYYSKKVMRFIRKYMTNDLRLDKVDRLILYYLSQGIKTSDLPELVYLSISAIERRKRLLKETFNLEKGNDKALIKIAQERGII
ncbi:DNA-binding response regulator [Flavobacteriaceae bacterium AU392]|nr:DNA-binding response regulator [Flavobacteriaceae bacterium]RKM84629.1 DNA-binding response regulator [Flavobacteriaceae bacterium AU392]